MAFYRRRPSSAPREEHLNLAAVERERERTDWSVVKILAILVAFLAFGFWYYIKDKEMVSSDGTVVQTTGSGPAAQPDANENKPAPPRAPPPSPPQ